MRNRLVSLGLAGAMAVAGCGGKEPAAPARTETSAEERGRRSSCCLALLDAIEGERSPSQVEPRAREYLLGPGGWGQEDLRGLDALAGIASSRRRWEEATALRDATFAAAAKAIREHPDHTDEIMEASNRTKARVEAERRLVSPDTAMEELDAWRSSSPAWLLDSLGDRGAGNDARDRLLEVAVALRRDDLDGARAVLRGGAASQGATGPANEGGPRR